MDCASYFIEQRAMFGGYPSQDQVTLMELLGFRHFVDLTSKTENKIKPYKTSNSNYISFPVVDGQHPISDSRLYRLVYKICEILSDTEDKIYIHCKGGHGRSGVIVALVTSVFFDVNADMALRHTNRCHNNRKEMRDIWRNMGSPQTPKQKNFVKMICSDNHIDKTNILHNEYHRSIILPGFDKVFYSIEDAHNSTGSSYNDIIAHNDTNDWRKEIEKSGLMNLIVPDQQSYARSLTQMRYNYFIRRDFV